MTDNCNSPSNTTTIPPHLHASKVSERINNNLKFKEFMKICIQALENCEVMPIVLPAWFKAVRGRFEVSEKYPGTVIRMVIVELNKAGYHALFEEISNDGISTPEPYIVINIEPPQPITAANSVTPLTPSMSQLMPLIV